MSLQSFLIIALCVIVTMLVCRVVPLFALQGKQLPAGFVRALNLIPPAAFAALVANDLLSPTMFSNGIIEGLIPLIAALLVVVVGLWRKSLIWCIIVGLAAYGILMVVL